MPKPITLYACAHCGQPHVTEMDCREHEAECLWDKRAARAA